MYIPWSLCILSITLSVGLTWYYRTKNMDFSPTNGVAGDISSLQKERSKNTIGPPKPSSLNDGLLLDSNIILALDSFSEIKNNKETLLRLFSIRSANQNGEAAYLVGERIMESNAFSDQEKRVITQKMGALLPKIQTWMIDRNGVYTLALEIGNFQGNPDEKAQLSQALESAFQKSSGGIVSLSVYYTENPSSLKIKYSDTFTVDSLLQTDPNTELIFSSLYSLLSNVIAVKFPDYILPQWNGASKAEFETGLTRLAWSSLLSSFPQNKAQEGQKDEN